VKVVGVVEYGGPDALRVFDVAEPHAGPGEVRIRVQAATVNPTDTLVRNGSRADAQKEFAPPYVPGMDVAGVLDELGDDLPAGRLGHNNLVIGDHVMAIVLPRGTHGGYAEHVVVPIDSVVRTPAGASSVEASTVPMNGLTARRALDLLALQPGQTLAVTGAAGAFGGYVVQLARAEGLQVVADASPTDIDLVRSLGAEVVARGDDVADRIRAIVPDGVDGLADGALLHRWALAAIRDGGALAAVRTYSGDTERGITIHPVWVRDYAREWAKLDRLRKQVEDGTLTMRVAGTFAPHEAPEAHRILEAGGTRGRLVIEF
jgi:NADPH:quinone reductase-like Zn-dependent oxidoreductase